MPTERTSERDNDPEEEIGMSEYQNLNIGWQGWAPRLGAVKPARIQALKKKVNGDEESKSGAGPGLESEGLASWFR